MTAVKQTIGVIGSLGDLGSQLVRRAKKYGFLVREFAKLFTCARP